MHWHAATHRPDLTAQPFHTAGRHQNAAALFLPLSLDQLPLIHSKRIKAELVLKNFAGSCGSHLNFDFLRYYYASANFQNGNPWSCNHLSGKFRHKQFRGVDRTFYVTLMRKMSRDVDARHVCLKSFRIVNRNLACLSVFRLDTEAL